MSKSKYKVITHKHGVEFYLAILIDRANERILSYSTGFGSSGPESKMQSQIKALMDHDYNVQEGAIDDSCKCLLCKEKANL
jgi:hypothetical protein